MDISIRVNTSSSEIGECTIRDGSSQHVFDYDRDDLAHELVNAYRDLFRTNDDWCKHLSHYLDSDDIKSMGFDA